jgi:hypothetical protein
LDDDGDSAPLVGVAGATDDMDELVEDVDAAPICMI